MPVRWRGRRGWRSAALAVVVALALAGCTTTTLSPSTPVSPLSSPVSPTTAATGETTSDAGPSAADTSSGATGDTPTGGTATDVTATEVSSTDVTATEVTPTGSTSTASSGTEPPTGEPEPATSVTTVLPPTYSPPADAEPVDGDCPYLPKDQVQSDTGQRMGATRIRPAQPQPVCEFVRNDGNYLATVRVLQLDSAAAAVSAVDFYIPRDASNPESRPAGWAGGSQATDDGSRYGVSLGDYAVIAETNQKQSVYARLLAVHAIENLGL